MDTNNEILDAIEILTNKKIGENITKILTGICKSVNINNNTCVMDSNGVISTVQFYGSPPEVNELYRIFVPSNNMSRSFIVVPPKFTVNPNLLDNWYFGNPVNQKGLTEYTESWKYGIDRWLVEHSSTVTLNTDHISISNGDKGGTMGQKIDNPSKYAGRQFTVSVLGKRKLNSAYMTIRQDSVYDNSLNLIVGTELSVYSLTFTAKSDLTSDFAIEFASWNASDVIDIYAVKLELGSTQTLAHLENGNWVLNEIPDYGEQLRKCQRYFLKIGDVVHYCSLGNGVARDDQFVSITIPTPVTMRTVPGLVAVPAGFTMRHSDTIVSGGANFSVDAFSQNSIMLKVQSQVALTPGDMWEAFLQPNGSLMFSADL